jgi:O-succinylbenzoic acid--CoA ligase
VTPHPANGRPRPGEDGRARPADHAVQPGEADHAGQPGEADHADQAGRAGHAGRRPLQAVLIAGVAGAGRLVEPLARALDGTGPAVLPLDADLPPAKIKQLIDVFQPGVVIDPDGEATVRSISPGISPDTAVIITTSGSTGEPKGVELSAAALTHSARASLTRVGARPGQRWLLSLPASHVAGVQVLVRSLLSGVEAALAPAATAAAIGAAGCRHISVVPTQLIRLLDEPDGAAALAEYESVLVGGAAAGEKILDRARAAGIRVVTTYGMSETCGGCVYDGVPLDGVRVRADGEGRLRISGPVLMNRYHGRPDLTADVLDGVEFVTSDLGFANGGRVVIRGRADDVINTGGHKVIPGEVAAALASCRGVKEVVVVGRPDPEWGERVTAVVVPADPTDPPGLELLRIHVRETLPRYASPSEVVLTEAIPVLPSGKPDLAALKQARTLRRREQSRARSVN